MSTDLATATTANPVPVILSADLSAPTAPYYAVQDGVTHRLVTLVQTVVMQVPPVANNVSMAPSLLPFGLLETITVSTGPGPQPDTTYKLHIHKITGHRESKWTPMGTPVLMVDPDMGTDHDATHPDLKLTKSLTGHEMRFRMIAASGILMVSISFPGEPPATVHITYQGTNAVPEKTTVQAAAAALRSRSKLALAFQPIRPGQRKNAASQLVMDMEKQLQTADPQ